MALFSVGVPGPIFSWRQHTTAVPGGSSLRAFAVAFVVISHTSPIPFAGAIGVDIFFVLSGFLITRLLLKEHDRTKRLKFKRFYIRRASRLYPALLLTATVMFLPGIVFAPSAVKYVAETGFAVTYTTPIALLFGDGASTSWRHTWTLGIEELFYLLWPLLFLAIIRLRKSRVPVVAALGIIVLFAGVGNDFLELRPGFAYFFRAGGLVFGCAFAFMLHQRPQLRVGVVFPISGSALIIGALFLPTTLGAIAADLGTVALVSYLVTHQSATVSRVLGARPLAYLGRISYEFYLWHYPLLYKIVWATGRASSKQRSSLYPLPCCSRRLPRRDFSRSSTG